MMYASQFGALVHVMLLFLFWTARVRDRERELYLPSHTG